MPPTVLIVDDEPIVLDVLSRYLLRDGFVVETALDGIQAMDLYRRKPPDLVLLDVMLPQQDGYEVLRFIRNHDFTPVIMLTAKGGEPERIAGLELGADDYVVKPFSPGEVVARVRAVLRRSNGTGDEDDDLLTFGSLEIDARSREVRLRGDLLEVTPKELDLLLFLATNPRRVFSRIELLDELWDFAFSGDPNTVTVHVRRLREKIEDDPAEPRHLVTVWGSGYRFDP